jgi:acetyl esterase/lipase
MNAAHLALVTLLALLAAGPATTKRTYAPSGPFTTGLPYKTVDGTTLYMPTQFPKDWKSSDRRPCAVLFYGGGWNSRWSTLYDGYADHLQSLGLVVLRPDYRLDGIEHATEDAKSAVRYARAHAAALGIDPDRIIATGGSAGGHLAAATATLPTLDSPAEDPKVSSKPNLLMVLCPVLNLANGRSDTGNALGPDRARAISPTLHLTKDLPPTLIMVAANDSLVDGCREFAARAADLRLDCSLQVAPTGGHGFFIEDPGQSLAFRWTDAFLTQHHYLTVAPTH